MSLLQKEQMKRRLGNAKFVSFHEISILDVVVLPYTLGIRMCKESIMLIQVFYVLKANDIQFKLSNKHAYTGKCICHNIFLTFNILDDIRKRLNKFTPLRQTLVQLSLTFEILECLMVRMKNEFMRSKIVFPNT